MADQIVIRAATIPDLPSLLQLYDHLTAGESPSSINDAISIFKNFERYIGSQIFIGLLEGNIVSSCALVVAPNLTRSGAARQDMRLWLWECARRAKTKAGGARPEKAC